MPGADSNASDKHRFGFIGQDCAWFLYGRKRSFLSDPRCKLLKSQCFACRPAHDWLSYTKQTLEKDSFILQQRPDQTMDNALLPTQAPRQNDQDTRYEHAPSPTPITPPAACGSLCFPTESGHHAPTGDDDAAADRARGRVHQSVQRSNHRAWTPDPLRHISDQTSSTRDPHGDRRALAGDAIQTPDPARHARACSAIVGTTHRDDFNADSTDTCRHGRLARPLRDDRILALGCTQSNRSKGWAI